MKQEQINANENEKQSTDLFEKFQQIRGEKTHRTVKLIFKSCCGCGCSDVEIERLVPFDSPLENGDRIHSKNVLESDKIIG